MYNDLASAFLFPAVRNPTDLTVRFDRFMHPIESVQPRRIQGMVFLDWLPIDQS